MDYYIVDAFTDKVFGGNPAAVFILNTWLDDDLMQKIAVENNLSETAFAVKSGTTYEIRWFTPDREIDLCGHATLATAYVLFNYYPVEHTILEFSSQSGTLFVEKKEQYYYLNFPSILPKPIEILPEFEQALGAPVVEAYLARDLFLVFDNEADVRAMTPDFSKLKEFSQGVGVIVTAKSTEVDFISRAFYPKLTINEDPVTGSAHSNLIPYWAEKLQKKELMAHQVSSRKGILSCQLVNDRVLIGGQAVLYAKGQTFF